MFRPKAVVGINVVTKLFHTGGGDGYREWFKIVVQNAIKPIRVLFYQVMLARLENKLSTFGNEETIFLKKIS